MNIIVAGALTPNKLDTPLNARFRIESIEDVPKIEAPAVGELFYVRSIDKHYKIVSLKSKKIGELVIQDAQIDQYQEFGQISEEEKAKFLMKEEAAETYSTKGQVEAVTGQVNEAKSKAEEAVSKAEEAVSKANDALSALDNVPTEEEINQAIQEAKQNDLSYDLEDGDFSEVFDQQAEVEIVETGLPDVSI